MLIGRKCYWWDSSLERDVISYSSTSMVRCVNVLMLFYGGITGERCSR